MKPPSSGKRTAAISSPVSPSATATMGPCARYLANEVMVRDGCALAKRYPTDTARAGRPNAPLDR